MTVDLKMTADSFGVFDFTISESGDFETEDSFDTALNYSILGERRANESEVVHPPLRRGWIGNEFNDYENGSKLWLFEQERVTRTILNRIEAEARNAFIWLVNDTIAFGIETRAVLSDSKIALEVDIKRPGSDVDRRYFELWDNTGVR